MKLRLLLLLLIIPSVFAYQQSYLKFDLDESWTVSGQRSSVQTFQKDNLILEVRVTQKELITPLEFAERMDGTVLSSENVGNVEESIVQTGDDIFLFADLVKDEETYGLVMYSDNVSLEQAKIEMRKLYATFSYSARQNFETSPSEEELISVKPLNPLKKVTIYPEWYFIIGVIVLFGLWIYWKVRKRKGKGKVKKEKNGKKRKK
ncbi:MAG: hypothetical protein KKG59_00190 [Nanoarchaeota archaeon]|nr:hypothetical protein [Nanoarchaeota archaeon]